MDKLLILAAIPLASCSVQVGPTGNDVAEASVKDDNRFALSMLEGHEAIIDEREFEAGKIVPPHKHAGVEMLHVVEGSITLQLEGQQPTVLEVGDTSTIPANTYHQARMGDVPGKAIIVRLHPNGEPDRIEPDREVEFPE